jgi:general secretion pathway protein G
MTLKPRPNAARTAFTLIELLVVIAIIAVLVSLTAAAVMRVVVKGPETQNATEIRELESAVATAKRDFGTEYIPSQVRLSEINYYPQANVPGSLDNLTVTFLKRAFGKHCCYDFQYPLPNGVFIDWNGNGQQDVTPDANGGPDGGFVLEGEQCLVFFLGGIPTNANGTPGVVGFSTNPQNPAAAGGTRKGPFYDFKSNRLKPGPNGNGYFVFMDAWGKQPYAYFTSYNSEGYGAYNPGDCASLKLPSLNPLVPYKEPNGKWVNPGSCQIISAGRDGAFGDPALWAPASGSTDANGRDDQSNFSSKLLGAPTQ